MSADKPQRRRVAVAVVVSGARVLVQTRAGEGPWKGYWEFPGGGVEDGESGAAAAQRECLEEVGLGVEVIEPIECRSWNDQQRVVEVEFFLCSTTQLAEPRPLLGQELAWLEASELGTRTFLPANASVIAWLQQRLGDSPGGR